MPGRVDTIYVWETDLPFTFREYLRGLCQRKYSDGTWRFSLDELSLLILKPSEFEEHNKLLSELYFTALQKKAVEVVFLPPLS